MDTLEYLARVGYDALLVRAGGNHPADDEDDPASVEAARLEDHASVRAALLAEKPKPSSNGDGCSWIGRITWPDRVPGLKTWAGQQTLAKLVASRQAAVASAPGGDLFALRVPLKGTTGLDAATCRDSLDIGFSPARLDMAIVQRPAMELLAIYGLETLPLVSYDWRECGFYHDGRLWRFTVEAREGGYLHRWGALRCHDDPRHQWAVPVTPSAAR